MCECGCYGAGSLYKLKADKGIYVVRTIPGCSNCDTPPGLVIEKPTRQTVDDFDYRHLPELPMCDDPDGGVFCMFVAGISSGEARKGLAAMACPKEPFDEAMADTVAEDFWKEHLTKAPSIPDPKARR